MKITFKPIGVVHSPFKRKEDIKSEIYTHPQGFEKFHGELEIFKEYEEGLKDVEGFSHLIILFAFHKSKGFKLLAKPLLDKTLRGIFAIRGPNRPNPIGMTVVKNIKKKGNILRVAGIDMIEGTPILDIKPYTIRDQKMDITMGWLTNKLNLL